MIVEIFNKKVLQKNMVNSENRADDDIADEEENFEDDDVDDDIADNESDLEDDDDIADNDENFEDDDVDGDIADKKGDLEDDVADKEDLQASRKRLSTKVAALSEKRKFKLAEEPSRKSARYRKVNSLFTDYV